MNKRIIFFLSLLIISFSAYCQEKEESVDIPDAFQIQMKVFEHGKNVFKLDTRKEAFSFSSPEKKNDTSMTFTWNDNAKRKFVIFLVKKGGLDEIRETSISKPANMNDIRLLTHLKIWKGEEKMEFWFKKDGNDKSSEAITKVDSNMKDPINEMIELSLKVIKQQEAGKE
jgi:hypothetical protein